MPRWPTIKAAIDLTSGAERNGLAALRPAQRSFWGTWALPVAAMGFCVERNTYQQVRRMNLKGFSQVEQHTERRIVTTALNATQIGHRKVSAKCQLLLRYFSLNAVSPDGRAEMRSNVHTKSWQSAAQAHEKIYFLYDMFSYNHFLSS